jgi:DNA-binding MarR family transcriptional regulator
LPKSTPKHGIAEGMLGGLIGYALRRAQLRVFEDFYALAGEGVTPARFSALIVIDGNPGISQTALAQALGIARSGVVSLIDTLEEMGLVRREAIAGDKRAYALQLTKKGRERLDRLRSLVKLHESRVTSKLSGKEKSQLLELLSRVG